MRHLKLLGGIIGVFILTVYLFDQYFYDGGYSAATYVGYHEAVQANAVKKGNLPDILPQDSASIYTCVDVNLGNVWASFSYGKEFGKGTYVKLRPEAMGKVEIPCLYGRAWWDGRLCNSIKESVDMEFYQSTGRYGREYVAVNRVAHRVYYWRSGRYSHR